MTDPERFELRGLRLGWSDDRTERLLTRVQGRLVRRRRAWRAAVASVAAAGGVGAVALVLALRASPPVVATVAPAVRPAPSAPAAAERIIRLAEGSEIRLQPATSEVRVIDEGASRVRVEQVRGASRYAVIPKPARTFEVSAGSVTITVAGTEFVVERRGDAAWVAVERGKVRVAWGAGDDARALLGAGDSGLFPPPAGATPVPPPHGARNYRAQVARRDYQAAYAALSRDQTLAGDTVEELLLAADVARLSDHPGQAVTYLQRILREHPRDERAPMAAFTLGRTLSGLGQQRQAMEMFARVHATWPHGPLAEDALVREAEAAAALGDSARAAGAAEQYERDFPRGGRRAEVRRYAHLTPAAPPTPVAPVAPGN
jgi:transmembrane sensor